MSAISQFVKPGSEGLLSIIKPFFDDKSVSEILINKPNEVWIESKGRMVRHQVDGLDLPYIKRMFTFIANENGQVLTKDKPFLSGVCYEGSRVQLVIPPASLSYCLSIRKKTLHKVSLSDYQEKNFFESLKPFTFSSKLSQSVADDDKALLELYDKGHWHDFLTNAIKNKKNIIVSGGTSSGKTTFLNACTSLIPIDERIITLEDTREVELPHQNQLNLIAQKNGNISMQQLVQATLRLRPDRLIMGEIRGAEILDFIGACSTGHEGSIATIHANNPQIAIQRMIQLYKQNNLPSMRDDEIRAEINSVVDIIIQLKRTSLGRLASDIYFKLKEEID